MTEKKIIGYPKICFICGPSDLPTTQAQLKIEIKHKNINKNLKFGQYLSLTLKNKLIVKMDIKMIDNKVLVALDESGWLLNGVG